MTVYSPITGKIIPLENVPDEAFSSKMLGDGVAIESNETKRMTVVSPVEGTIVVFNPNLHAIVVESNDGLEVLIHIGVDTVALKGKGFKAKAKEGQKVKVGSPLVEVDLRYIRENAPASMVIVLLTNKPDEPISIVNNNDIKEKTPLFNYVEGAVVENNASANSNEVLTEGSWITIINPNGLHARPASSMAKQAVAFSGKVMIEKDGGNKVDAKSATAIMGLGLGKGTKARFWAGDKKTLESLTRYLENGAGEDVNAVGHVAPVAKSAINDAKNLAVNFTKEEKITLNPASPGLASGKLFVLAHSQRDVEENSKLTIEDEKDILKAGLEKAAHSIKVELNVSSGDVAAILEAHLSFVEDTGLYADAEALIKQGKTAPYAWQATTTKMANDLTASDSEYMQARAGDMRDVGRRVLDMILGEEDAPDYPANSVVVGLDFTPSDITRFTKNVIAGVTVEGSATGHAAIMMRNSGIPSLYGAPKALLNGENGINVIVDGDASIIIINPSEATLKDYSDRIAVIQAKKAESLATAKLRGETKDGHRVEISGNVSSVKEGIKATEQGGEGYGLARSEFLFYGRQTAPTEEEQLELYQGLMDATTHDVTVRLLDAGGDKPIVYVVGPKEDNPLLGIRGMRIWEENEELYRTQFRALLRCKPLNRLKIMVPMISLIGEVHDMRKMFNEEMDKLGIKKEDGPRFGIMAETPAVCAMADQFAKLVDFFSVGTNDLSQYTMAMDRTSARLAKLAKATNPSILKLIQMLCEGASPYKVPVAVCGAAASDPITALLFVGLGVEELAVSGSEIPEIKALLRKFTLQELQDAAKEAVKLSTDAEVIAFIKQRFNLL